MEGFPPTEKPVGRSISETNQILSTIYSVAPYIHCMEKSPVLTIAQMEQFNNEYDRNQLEIHFFT
jgi:hypothetical protein